MTTKIKVSARKCYYCGDIFIFAPDYQACYFEREWWWNVDVSKHIQECHKDWLSLVESGLRDADLR